MEGIFEKIGIDSGIVIIAILVAMLVLILTVLVLVARVRDISNKYANFMRGEDGKSLEKSFERRFQEVGTVVRSQAAQSNRMQFMESIQNRSLTRYGIVKYDAFDDVGGKLSFALAMLDRNDTGFVLNAIHSKENCYLYLKEVVKGESYIMLSHEEVEALRAAKKFGSEEEAILKYQLDKSVRAEKQSVKKLQEMRRPQRKTSHGGSYTRRTASAASAGDKYTPGSPGAEAAGRYHANVSGTATAASAAAVMAGATIAGAAAAYSAGDSAYKNDNNHAEFPPMGESEKNQESSLGSNDGGVYQNGYDSRAVYSGQISLDASAYSSTAGYDAPVYASQPVTEPTTYGGTTGYDVPSYTPKPMTEPTSYDSGAEYEAQNYVTPAGYDPAAYTGTAANRYRVDQNGATSGQLYPEPTDSLQVSSELSGEETLAYEASHPAENEFVENQDMNTGDIQMNPPLKQNYAKAGNRRNGQPPKKARRNKNRKTNERKEQNHAGH